MSHGYGAKVSYNEISTKMTPHITNNAKLNIKDMCRDTFIAMGCDLNAFKLGQTHVVFRPKYEHVVDQYYSLDLEKTKKIGENVGAMFKSRQRHALYILLRFVGTGKFLELFTLIFFIE